MLSGQTIRRLGIFTPFEERSKFNGMTYGLGPAGYDVRVDQDITLVADSAVLASTMEHFDMPTDVLGQVADKSTWARRFIAVQNTIVEPGWNGYLTLELSNHGTETIHIPRGSPIAQIVLFRLDEPAEKPYAGKYQGQLRGITLPIAEG